MIDLGSISPWALYDTITRLEPESIYELATVNSSMAEICQSQTLWYQLYHDHFPPSVFPLEVKKEQTNWINRYSRRRAISSNIARHKPKVKSFPGKDITQLRSFTNAFAFSSSDNLTLFAFQYYESSCEYQLVKNFNIQCKDFLILDATSIVAVGNNVVSIINVINDSITSFPKEIGDSPMIHAISQTHFAVVSNSKVTVYDTSDNCESKCTFRHTGIPLSVASSGSTLYIATATDLSAHDTKNPRGPILWNTHNPGHDDVTFCSFNIDNGLAVYGDSIINLISGRVLCSGIAPQATCGSILNNHIAIIGCKMQAVIFYDFVQQTVLNTIQFGNGEGIRQISSSSLNERVAIAGDFTTRLFYPHLNGDTFVVDEIKVIQAGSVGMRQKGEIGKTNHVIFDGERLVLNMGSFVRVYDFYVGK